jgi:hypothetical protein
LKTQLYSLVNKNLETPEKGIGPEFLLTEGNKFVILMAMDEYYLPDSSKKEILSSMADKTYQLVLRYLKDKTLFSPAIPAQLNVAIQFWLTLGKPSDEKIIALLHQMSPLEGNGSAEISTCTIQKVVLKQTDDSPVITTVDTIRWPPFMLLPEIQWGLDSASGP